MKQICGLLLVAPLLIAPASAATPAACRGTRTVSEADATKTVPSLCVGNRLYTIRYSARGISLRTSGKTQVLHRIPRGYDPSLAGAERLIGFLPPALQVAIDRQVVFYISTIRTNGGGGGGQCGAGAEIYFNAVDLRTSPARILGHHLIGSCSGIELNDANPSDANVGDITVVDGRLVFNFLFYRDHEGDVVGHLSPDFRQLNLSATNRVSDDAH